MSALIVANWKMNGSMPAIAEFVEQWQAMGSATLSGARTVICPPYPYLSEFRKTATSLELGAQDCSVQGQGAYTGEVAPAMLSELGCRWVILGHSERRQYHQETDALVALKVANAKAAGLATIVCVGEHLAQREAGNHKAVVESQLAGSLEGATPEALVIAYEPVWAIGTGVSASAEQADDMHRWIRECLSAKYGETASEIAVIYGGSVKPDTAGELFACDMIDGGLVGGASLEARSFHEIAQAASDSGRE